MIIDVDLLDFKRPLNLIKNFTIGRFVYVVNQIQQISFFNVSNVVADIVCWSSNKSAQIVNYIESGYVRGSKLDIFTKNIVSILSCRNPSSWSSNPLTADISLCR